jgi:hypothetical protein
VGLGGRCPGRCRWGVKPRRPRLDAYKAPVTSFSPQLVRYTLLLAIYSFPLVDGRPGFRWLLRVINHRQLSPSNLSSTWIFRCPNLQSLQMLHCSDVPLASTFSPTNTPGLMNNRRFQGLSAASRSLLSGCPVDPSEEAETCNSDDDDLPSVEEIIARSKQVIDLTLDNNDDSDDTTILSR